MKILSADPGLSALGLCLYEPERRLCLRSWTVRTSPADSFAARMAKLSAEISAALDGVDLLIVEDQHDVAVAMALKGRVGNGSGRLEQVVGMARGLADSRGIPFLPLAPATIRALLGLPSNAKKAAVARVVRMQVSGVKAGISEHAVDAIGIALAGSREWHAREVLAGARRVG